MPLLEPTTTVPIPRLREIRQEMVADLDEMTGLLADPPGVAVGRAARSLTARSLVVNALAWAHRQPPTEDRATLVAELNLLYDVGIVAAEYYKLFVREPTPARPAGRI